MLVAVEDPDDDPGDAEQDDDREEDPRERRPRGRRRPGRRTARMTSGARTMKSAVSAPRPSSKSQKRVEATRQARLRSPFSSSSLKTGTNADESAASATSARTRFGTWKATVKALIWPRDAEVVARRRSRGRGRGRARARWRARRSPSTTRAAGRGPRVLVHAREYRNGRSRITARAATIARPPDAGLFTLCRTSSNRRSASAIAAQRAAREPALPLDGQDAARSRLRAAVEDGDKEQIAAEHRALVRWIDRPRRRALCTATRRRARSRRRRSSSPAQLIPPRRPARRRGRG